MTVIQTRIDDKVKKHAEEVFNSLGITLNDGIRLFLNQVRIDRGLPFRPTLGDEWAAHNASSHIPNKETEGAIRKVKAGIGTKTFKTKEALFKDLGI
ncbi:MAG: type II toxin-antitoxin system RelB/DinJ family antitoxin [Rickettsiales bacterium]|jgi:addiction module RelB/DinJ family antitoxin|nr:type II toxin-antitoxin system RelB/DinJ family antitoxin [Rickettsiales bacterium]